MSETLRTTVLHDLHVGLDAKMVPFAGYDMPVQYPDGILTEHRHTRDQAGLFDVGHMGQAILRGDNVVAALETLVPGDIAGLEEGQIRYTQFTNEAGGILDDLMVTNRGDHLFLVVNAGCKDADYAHIVAQLGSKVELEIIDDRGLIALQGPEASGVLARHASGVETMPFMTLKDIEIAGISCLVSRSGYTGEDGYEISVPGTQAAQLAEILLAEAEVAPVGLGARDTLRLEAGLCLYGHDIDETTSPIEAGLLWSIGKRRREEGGFLGADRIISEIANKPSRRRVGILPEGRAPARDHTEITDRNGTKIGTVTSGGFGPSVNGPIAMGYVATEHAAVDTSLQLTVRGKSLNSKVIKLPFVKQNYYRG
ncbi:MAG: glycine cleavage system aminomethyltransferase GcvT [Rhodospirillaceae bacterium]|jgi:aminomethyltransferase|nr:glycine cleavage system aminomethyltransferase GcvT [Rhodospirillaceae bacterium]MBT4587990.1 glycine cleavage system aminomethyltransferase GcvT [Rhodospirillaceae bacterium]MBT4939505.1 glycine cleavage system aminomethyltransferase GcvT [Rhodospirillaceae bacterium]MBT7267093.1 glycine cleavage system aminomethyltransferase GcvT [Rhodospirillaceae bacterium]